MHPNSLARSLAPSLKLSFLSPPLSMENALNQTNLPIFQCKETKTHQNPLMGNALLREPLPAGFQTSRGTRRKRGEYLKAQKKQDDLSEGEEDDDGDGDDEKAEVKRKIVALQKIVPGGESLGVEKLFEETAGYILALQCQIKAMRALTSLIEGLEKQKRKLGG